MNSRRDVLVVTVTGAVLLIAMGGLALNMISPPNHEWRVAQVAGLLIAFWFAGVGGFLVLRVPGNVTARAVLAIGAIAAVANCCEGLLNADQHGVRLPEGLVRSAAWMDNWNWLALFGWLFVLLMYFPDGRAPGRFWRPVELSVYAVVTAGVLICASSADSFDYPQVHPLVLIGPVTRLSMRSQEILVNGVVLGYLGVAVVALVIALLVRWRRSHGTRRAQLKWLLASVAVFVGLQVAFSLIDGIASVDIEDAGWADLADQIGIWLIPIAIGVAVTRHGLFEIDRLVSRTVSYAVVVALLAGAYVAVVAGTSALVPDRYGSVSVVLATLAVSALFVPVRRRVIAVVDRRFNRSRYDAAVVVSQFAERVRGRAGTGTTDQDLVVAARQVLQPAHATVWLAPRGQA